MGLLIDLHVHTSRHSSCSHIDADLVVGQAVRAGLDGVVLTEHHHQWREEELTELIEAAEEPNFLLLAGFEYTSSQGDLLMFGLNAETANAFPFGLAPEDAVERVHRLGGVCIAAHPTRAGMGFDERILTIPLDGIEVQSVNLREHEQRLAARLAKDAGLRPIASSDAHELTLIGRYATEFDVVIQSMADLQQAIRNGRFRPVGLEGQGVRV
jgi:predicted metal-dependent phosphoesterase TrpH